MVERRASGRLPPGPAPYTPAMTRRPDPSHLDDPAVVELISCREQRALQVVYERHGSALFGLARRVLGRRDHAEEIVQEVLLRLWNEPRRFDAGRGALRSFLYREVHSRSVERVRSEKARRGREERFARQRPAAVDDLESEAWDLIRSELVTEAMAQLTDGERQAIDLAFFGGHTYREVARLLGQPEGTVKSRIRHGLMKLADALADRGLGANR